MQIVTKEELDQMIVVIKNELLDIKEIFKNSKPKRIMKNKELQKYLGCSYSTLEKLRDQNIIPYKKVMGNYYYSVDDVNRIFIN
jgi:hypothetical protein